MKKRILVIASLAVLVVAATVSRWPRAIETWVREECAADRKR